MTSGGYPIIHDAEFDNLVKVVTTTVKTHFPLYKCSVKYSLKSQDYSVPNILSPDGFAFLA